jgi:hypothetical protein
MSKFIKITCLDKGKENFELTLNVDSIAYIKKVEGAPVLMLHLLTGEILQTVETDVDAFLRKVHKR